jgi:hypothetical protein
MQSTANTSLVSSRLLLWNESVNCQQGVNSSGAGEGRQQKKEEKRSDIAHVRWTVRDVGVDYHADGLEQACFQRGGKFIAAALAGGDQRPLPSKLC